METAGGNFSSDALMFIFVFVCTCFDIKCFHLYTYLFACFSKKRYLITLLQHSRNLHIYSVLHVRDPKVYIFWHQWMFRYYLQNHVNIIINKCIVYKWWILCYTYFSFYGVLLMYFILIFFWDVKIFLAFLFFIIFSFFFCSAA